MKQLMKCKVCGNYTLSQSHCNQSTISPHPVSSGVEKNIKERIKARIEKLEENELKGEDNFSIPY